MAPVIDRVGWSVSRSATLQALAERLATTYDSRLADRIAYEIGAICDARHQLLGIPNRTQLRVWAKRRQRPMTASLGAEGVGPRTPVPDVEPGHGVGTYLQEASVADWLWLHPRHHWLLDRRVESPVDVRPGRP